jgi:Acetyltransferases
MIINENLWKEYSKMAHTENPKYQIRNYIECDAGKIGEFDKILELSYRYYFDFVPENIFCAINSNEEILGVGHIEPHDTWNLINRDDVSSDFVYKMVLCISLNPQFSYSENLKDDLLKRLIDRAIEIREQYPHKKIRVFKWLSSEDYNEIDFYLSQGFVAFQNSIVMKYDLSQRIPDIRKPEGITVNMSKLESEEELKQYHEAESIAFSGIVWSMNLLRWYRGGPEWICFSVFNENHLIGSSMTWMITEERSAIENIFVMPEWRNKNIAKYMITEALKYLKNKGKSIATLSVHGDNKPAISLYNSLGFKMFGIMIEFGYDI